MELLKNSWIGRFCRWLSHVFCSGWIFGFLSSAPTDSWLRKSFLWQPLSKVYHFIEEKMSALSDRTNKALQQSAAVGALHLLLRHFLSLHTGFYGLIFGLIVLGSFFKGFAAWKLLLLAAAALGILLRYPISRDWRKSWLVQIAFTLLGEPIPEGRYSAEGLSETRLIYGLVCGIILGVVSAAAGPLAALLLLIGTFGMLLVLWRYEMGVLATLFAAPLVPTMLCVGLCIWTLFSFAVRILREGKLPKIWESAAFWILLLIGLYAFYTVTSLTPVESAKVFMVYAVFILSFFLVVSAVRDKRMLSLSAAVFVLSGLLVSLYGIYQQFFGVSGEHAWVDEEMFGSMIRVCSTLENPNVLGEYLLLMIPITVALLWTRKTWPSRVFYAGVLALSLICMIFTQSRGCWIGLIVVAAVFVLFAERRLIPLGLVAILLLPFVMPESIVQRFASIGNLGDSSTSYRVYIWLGTMAMLHDYGIFGLGLGICTFNKIYPFYAYSEIVAPHSHNLYLQILTETGIGGLATVAVIILLVFRKLIYTFMQQPKKLGGLLAITIFAGLCGFLIQGAFDYVWYNYRVFLIFWLTLGLGMAAYHTRDEVTP